MTYPKTKDWPKDDSRIDIIGSNGNEGDHYDLTDYLSKQDEMKALQKEVVELRESTRKLKKNLTQWKSKYKALHIEAFGKGSLLTRSDKITLIIKDTLKNGVEGSVSSNIRKIAKANHMSVSHTDYLWYRAVNEQRTN